MRTKLHDWHLAHGARMVDFGGLGHARAVRDRPPGRAPARPRGGGALRHRPHGQGGGQRPGRRGLPPARADLGRLPPGPGPRPLQPAAERRPAAWWTTSSSTTGNLPGSSSSTRPTLPRTLRGSPPTPSGFKVYIRDLREETCLVALQGPAAREVLQALAPGADLAGMGFHRVAEQTVAGARVVLCTTGLHRGARLRDPHARPGLHAPLGGHPGSRRRAAAASLRPGGPGFPAGRGVPSRSTATRSTRPRTP